MTDFTSNSPPIPTIANKQTSQGEKKLYDIEVHLINSFSFALS